MKIIDIVGDNYLGKWNKTRNACRGIVIENSEILLSYESVTGQWMIPGGGLEENESEADCCIREVAEETGILVNASECMLEIDEYYENWKLINKYFICKVKGTAEPRLTERERNVGMEARWLSVDNAKNIFSKHASYTETDEMRRGLYLREYTALCELV